MSDNWISKVTAALFAVCITVACVGCQESADTNGAADSSTDAPSSEGSDDGGSAEKPGSDGGE